MSPKRLQKRNIVCKYLSFKDPIEKTTYKLPLLHLRLKHNDVSLRTIALIDSGATTTFVPKELCGILGFKFKSQAELKQLTKEQIKELKIHDVTGAGGKFQAYLITLDCVEILKSINVFCELKKIEVLVPINENSIPYTVMGRDILFLKYDIIFRENVQHTVLRTPKRKI